MVIPIWQKMIGILIYLLPWSDALPFGKYLFVDFPILQWLAFPALPIILVEQIIPFGSLILFFVLFLAVVRNRQMAYFIRFNTLQALLIDIAVIVMGYASQIFLQPLEGTLIASTLSSTVLMSILSIVIFSFVQCLRGKEPDLPGFSEAVRMQL